MTTATRTSTSPTHPAALRDGYDRMVRATAAGSGFIRRPSGDKVHVIEAGEGPPVVHVHGNNTSSLSHLMLLQHLYRVRSVLVDRPGFGLSDPGSWPTGRFREYAVRFIDDVLDALGVESVVLAGASGGGVWSMWYALDRPERTRGLVLIGSVPLLPGSRIPLGLRLMGTPGLGSVLTRVMRPNRRLLLSLLSSMGEGDTILRHPQLLDSLIAAAGDPVAAAANLAEFRTLLSPTGVRASFRFRPDDLRRLTVPTLLIWGDHDPVVSVAAARGAAGLMPDARLEVLPAGHVPQLGHPERVVSLLEDFVCSLP